MMRKHHLKIWFPALLMISFSLSCTKKEDEANGLNYQIPQVTDPVGVVRGASVTTSSSSLKLMDQSSITACTNAGNCNDTNAVQMFNMGSTFVTTAAAADIYTCLARSLVNGGDIATDGSATVFTDESGFKIRMTATVSGDSLSSYTIQVCESGASQNAQFTSGTLGADGATSIKLKLDGNRWSSNPANSLVYMDLTGNYTGGIWNSKQLTFEAQDPSSSYSTYIITQGTDNLVIQAAGSAASGWQAYGKFKLLGSTAQEYAFDEGSAITPGASISSWDTNGNTGGSAYRSEVQAGQMISVPTAFHGAFSSSDNWNCQAGSEKTLSFNAISEKSAMGLSSCLAQ